MSTARKLPSPDDMQFNLLGGVPTAVTAPQLRTALTSARRFITGDAQAIFWGRRD